MDRGLFYMDTDKTGTLLVNTVAQNKASYTNRDYSRALLARQIQKTIGRPSTRDFINIVDNKLLPNADQTYPWTRYWSNQGQNSVTWSGTSAITNHKHPTHYHE